MGFFKKKAKAILNTDATNISTDPIDIPFAQAYLDKANAEKDKAFEKSISAYEDYFNPKYMQEIFKKLIEGLGVYKTYDLVHRSNDIILKSNAEHWASEKFPEDVRNKPWMPLVKKGWSVGLYAMRNDDFENSISMWVAISATPENASFTYIYNTEGGF